MELETICSFPKILIVVFARRNTITQLKYRKEVVTYCKRLVTMRIVPGRFRIFFLGKRKRSALSKEHIVSPDESSFICPLAPFRAMSLIVKWSYGLKFSPSGQPVLSLFF